MCDLLGGSVVVAHPDTGPEAQLANFVLEDVAGRYGARVQATLGRTLENRTAPVLVQGKPVPRAEDPTPLPFEVELVAVEDGQEMSFVDELASEYLDAVLHHPDLVPSLAQFPERRLMAAPNWTYGPSLDIADPVTEPFRLGPRHDDYRGHLGLLQSSYPEAEDVVVAVLDNGFDPGYLAPESPPGTVMQGEDLLPGASGTAGHGTLISTIVTAAAPGVRAAPLRMAGDLCTEFDTLHALARAVQMDAPVLTLSYNQRLRADEGCDVCGVRRRSARSAVFSAMVEWAAGHGRRAVLVSAGNNGYDTLAQPAAYPGALPVTALDRDLRDHSARANHDGSGRHLVFAAPGEDVAVGATGRTFSGTSYAVGYVAALLAVAMARLATDDAAAAVAALNAESGAVGTSRVPVLPAALR